MDNVPRASWKAVVVAAGFFIFVGAGCRQKVPESMFGIRFDQLVFDDAGDHSYIHGLQVVCSLENARVLFAKDKNWDLIEMAVREKQGKEGWRLSSFCYTPSKTFFVFEDSSNIRDAAHDRFMLGMDFDGSVIFSDPFTLGESGMLSSTWEIEWVNGNRGVAVIAGTNPAYAWNMKFVLDPEQRKVKMIEHCSIGRTTDLPDKKIQIPRSCELN